MRQKHNKGAEQESKKTQNKLKRSEGERAVAECRDVECTSGESGPRKRKVKVVAYRLLNSLATDLTNPAVKQNKNVKRADSAWNL